MRDVVALLALLVLVACSGKQDPPGKTEENPLHSGSKWPTFSAKHHLQVPAGATESIFLFGAFNNGRLEENILVARVGGETTLEAWWMDWGGRSGFGRSDTLFPMKSWPPCGKLSRPQSPSTYPTSPARCPTR